MKLFFAYVPHPVLEIVKFGLEGVKSRVVLYDVLVISVVIYGVSVS